MEIYQHFRKEEQAFLDQVIAWQTFVEDTYMPKRTDFLNPREQYIVESVIGKHHDMLRVYKHGGNPDTERKRLVLASMYDDIQEDEFQLAMLEARYPDKFVTLKHRDVMGAFLSLGIKRKKLGDIAVHDGIIHMIVAAEIVSYIKANLTHIQRTKIHFEEKPLVYFNGEQTEWLESEQTVSSLRIDTVLKEIYNVSRKKAGEFIEKGLVKVNHKVVDNPSITLCESDLISVRGKGRSKLCAVQGQSKKGKWRITTAILKF